MGNSKTLHGPLLTLQGPGVGEKRSHGDELRGENESPVVGLRNKRRALSRKWSGKRKGVDM